MQKLLLRVRSAHAMTFAIILTALLISPLSLFLQTSSFLISLDIDGSEGDQGITSLVVSSDRDISIQIFGRDIQNASGLATRFAYDATQIVYEGFDAGRVLPNAQTLLEQDSTTVLQHNGTSSVQINMVSSDGSAIVNTGLIGTLRFRTTDAFSGTEIRLVRSELERSEQSETVSRTLSVALQVAVVPSSDFDGSGVVDFPDFLVFVSAFGSSRSDEKYETKYDLNDDGKIAFDDFLIFVNSFGKAVNSDVNKPRAAKSVTSTSDFVSVCDRTPQVRDAIVAEVSGVSDCSDVTANHLAAITRLGVVFKGISTLKVSDFSGLSALEGLYLNGNQLTTLEAGIFSDLTALETLLLWGNQFSTLEAGIFSDLTALRELSLSNNQFSTLKVGIFSGLTTLQSVTLANNQLTTLEAGVFSDLTALRILDLSNNQLDTLKVGVFSGLSDLHRLNLSNNQLDTLKVGVFSGLSDLHQLDLYDNQLTTLEAGAFAKLPALRKIYLMRNQLTSLEDSVFVGLKSLETLGLSQNPVDPLPITVSLELVEEGQFYAKAHTGAPFDMVLPILVVNGTLVDGEDSITIPTGSVTSDTVTVSRTPNTNISVTVDIGELPDPPGPPTNLSGGYALVKSADLPLEAIAASDVVSVCDRTPQVRDAIVAEISGISDCSDVTVDRLAAITRLDLAFKGISTLKIGDFSGLTSLERLDLNGNQLSTLEAGIFSDVPSLRTLLLWGNQFSTLEVGVFSDLSALRNLYLEKNQLSTLKEGIFSGLTSLRAVFLSNNQLTTLESGVFSDVPSLLSLYLDGNQLNLEVGVFSDLSVLRILDLANNQLDILKVGVFSGLSVLTVLDLSDNQLTTLKSGVFSDVPSLLSLSLTRNHLSMLEAGVFSGLTALKTLGLGQNAVDPLPITISLELVEEGQFYAKAHTGAPFNMVLPIRIANGTLVDGEDSITIPTGNVASDVHTVSRTPNTTTSVTVDIGELPDLPGQPENFRAFDIGGYALVKSADLPIVVIPQNHAPVFADVSPINVNENSTVSVVTVSATDVDEDDDITGYDIVEGADGANFEITDAGVLTFTDTPDYEDPKDVAVSDPANDAKNNEYIVVVEVTSGVAARALTATVTVTVTVTDVDTEAPGVPDAPTIAEATLNSLKVSWSVPTNTGPEINAYDVRYILTSTDETDDANWTVKTDAWTSGDGSLEYTIRSLSSNTSYDVQVRAKNAEGTGDWSDSVEEMTGANKAPIFSDGTSTTRSFSENTAAGQDIGAAISATDSDGGTLIYSLEGADENSFAIVETSGQLQTKAGEKYNYEEKNNYSVTVKVEDGQGGSATIDVAITVTNVDEPPGKPAAPIVASKTLNSLTVNWTAPENTGPAISAYDVRYILSSADETVDANWTLKEDVWKSSNGGTLEYTISSLDPNTDYDVQVRAESDEGTGEWSEEVEGMTAQNRPPVITSASAISVSENSTAAIVTVTATDSDNDDNITGYEITGGVDQGQFELDDQTRVLTFKIAPDFERPEDVASTDPASGAGDNVYIVVVEVTSGEDARELTATQTITVTVNDVDTEVPEQPAVPTVADATLNSLKVSWTAPTNTGPEISAYDVRYILSNAQDKADDNWTVVEDAWTSGAGGALEYTISSLEQNTDYDVQVRAKNAEGTGDWSDSASGMTIANQVPTFSEGTSTTRSFAENTAAEQDIGAAISATDSDGGTLTYSLEGTDAESFSIVSDSGQLQTKAGVTYDYEGQNNHSVTVKVEDGQGGSATIDVTVILTDVNEAPVFSSTASFNVSENTTDAVTVTATDVDGADRITGYEITGGEDKDLFEITNEGVLSFKEAPDFESPADIAKDNDYIVEVTATGGAGERTMTAVQTITVHVTDENEAPVFADISPITVNENITVSVVTVTATDADDDITGYSIVEAADGSEFEVTDGGVLSFKEVPNYEAPTDVQFTDPDNAANNNAGDNNEYIVIVIATSGVDERERTARDTLTVTVSNQPGEAPDQPVPPIVTLATWNSLTVVWLVPDNKGPEITGYDVQYRIGSSGDFTDWPHDGTEPNTIITDLNSNKTYEVQVRAKNDEGLSIWSASVSEMTAITPGICARTEAVQTAILSAIDGVTDCAQVTEEHLNEITGTLALRDQSIVTLQENDFSGLSSLSILRLDRNSLQTLPKRLFSDLSNIRTIRLDRNSLETLPKRLFSGLSTLYRIDLSNNMLNELPDSLFYGLSNLTVLDVSKNTGAPFTLTLMLERTDNASLTAPGPATVVVKVAQGAPFDMTISLSATNGTLTDGDENTITEAEITKGSIQSEPITVTQNGVLQVTLSLGTEPAIPESYKGLQVALGAPIVLFSPEGICTRTEAIQTAILSAIDGVTDCAQVTDAHLSGIEGTLDLRNQSIATLQENDFSGLSSLSILRLVRNSLQTLPDRVFSDLSSLERLELGRNDLRTLPDNVFSDLSSLQTLRLESNQLSQLPDRVFSDLSNLQTLNLKNNTLSALPDSLFYGLSSLRNLDVSGNPGAPFTLTLMLERTDNASLTAPGPATVVVKVAQGAPFDMTVSLSATNGTLTDGDENTITEATISKGSVESQPITVMLSGIGPAAVSLGPAPALPADYTGFQIALGAPLVLFKPGICSRTLAVQNAILSALDGVTDCAMVTDTHLAGITGTLNIGNQSITALLANDFSGLSNLQNLWLHENNLSTLPDNVFSDLSNLQTLSLYRNDLSTLPDNVFSDLSNLQTLSLDGNDLMDNLSANVFTGLSSLQTLSLYDNRLNNIPKDIFTGLSSLQTLSLYDNRLNNIPEDIFTGLSSLQTLSLYDNRLNNVPKDIFTGLSNLQTLSLSNNNLETLPDDTFSDLSSLRFLSLDRNALGTLPDHVFSDLSSLQTLNLSDNQLSALPDSAFFDLSGLQILNLKDNMLSSLPDSMFYGLSSLRKLDLSDNKGVPFTLTLMLERTDNADLTAAGPATVVVKVVQGAPFDMTVRLSATHGILTDGNGGAITEATISKGSIQSEPITVTHSGISSARVSLRGREPNVPSGYEGIHTDLGTSLVLFGEAVNRVPEAVGSIAAQTLKEGGNEVLVNVEDNFLDPDGDNLSYSATSNMSGVASVSVTGSEVTITPVSAGSATVTVTASDPNDLSATQEFEVLVKNTAPVVDKGLTDQTVFSDSAFTYTFPTNAFSDADNDVLIYTSSGRPTWLTFTPASRTFSGTPSNTDGSPFTITVTAYDGKGSQVQASFTLTIPIGICSRTSQIKTAILSVIDGVDNCAHVTEEHLVGIVDSLNLRSQNITALQANDFSGMPNLRILNFYNNDLTSLPLDVFSGLSNLRFLSLDNNDLRGLPVGVFSGLSNLRFLSLNSNSVSTLPADVFSGLSNLETLSFNGNMLSALPDSVFFGLASLSHLDASGNTDAPLSLTLALERTDNTDLTAAGPAAVVVKIAQGAPFDMTISLSATNGTLTDGDNNTITEVTISKGSIQSEPITVTQSGATSTTVGLGSAPALPVNYVGLRIDVGTSLVLFGQ